MRDVLRVGAVLGLVVEGVLRRRGLVGALRGALVSRVLVLHATRETRLEPTGRADLQRVVGRVAAARDGLAVDDQTIQAPGRLVIDLSHGGVLTDTGVEVEGVRHASEEHVLAPTTGIANRQIDRAWQFARHAGAVLHVVLVGTLMRVAPDRKQVAIGLWRNRIGELVVRNVCRLHATAFDVVLDRLNTIFELTGTVEEAEPRPQSCLVVKRVGC